MAKFESTLCQVKNAPVVLLSSDDDQNILAKHRQLIFRAQV